MFIYMPDPYRDSRELVGKVVTTHDEFMFKIVMSKEYHNDRESDRVVLVELREGLIDLKYDQVMAVHPKFITPNTTLGKGYWLVSAEMYDDPITWSGIEQTLERNDMLRSS